MAYQLHALCLQQLRRYCYLSLFDSDLDKYFGYSTGTAVPASWSPTAAELRRYPAPRVRLAFNQTEQFLWRTLLPALVNETAPLVEVMVRGQYMPELSFGSQAAAERLVGVPRLPLPPGLLDPCLCRHVSEPLDDAINARMRAITAPVAVHLRTGFADASDRALRTARRADPQATARWVHAACGSGAPLVNVTAPRLILTDSPGLLEHLERAHPGMVLRGSTDGKAASCRRRGPLHESSRSWRTCWAVKKAALDDVVAASWATTLQVAPQRTAEFLNFRARAIQRVLAKARRRRREAAGLPADDDARKPPKLPAKIGRMASLHWSGFTWPVVLRSMCLTTISAALPSCPYFAETFVRDFNWWMESASAPEFERLQKLGFAKDAPNHPCRVGNASSCERDWVAALGG